MPGSYGLNSMLKRAERRAAQFGRPWNQEAKDAVMLQWSKYNDAPIPGGSTGSSNSSSGSTPEVAEVAVDVNIADDCTSSSASSLPCQALQPSSRLAKARPIPPWRPLETEAVASPPSLPLAKARPTPPWRAAPPPRRSRSPIPRRPRQTVDIFVGGEGDQPPVTCHVVNCLVFNDASTFRLRSHLGCHHEMMESVIRHADFEPIFREIAAFIQARTESHVYMQCRKGKHRSVAMAKILEFVVKRVHEHAVVQIHYLAKYRWSDDQHECMAGQCLACVTVPANIDDAVRAWG